MRQLGGLRELGSLNGEAHKAGLTITELLAIDHPAIAFAKVSLWLNAGIVSVIYWALLTKNPKFRLIASGLLLASWPMGALIGAAYPFDGLGVALGLSIFPWAISCGVWVTYLNRSKRVRVTFENEILIESSGASIVPTRDLSPGTPGHARTEPQTAVTHMNTRDEAPEEEQFWSAALGEVEGPSRRPGLWARSFSEAEGDEARAKAKYLAYRASELEREHRGSEDRRAQDEAQPAQRRLEALERQSESERAYALLPKGTCPNCDALIPLASETCPRCQAMFGPGSKWAPLPTREASRDEIIRQLKQGKRF